MSWITPGPTRVPTVTYAEFGEPAGFQKREGLGEGLLLRHSAVSSKQRKALSRPIEVECEENAVGVETVPGKGGAIGEAVAVEAPAQVVPAVAKDALENAAQEAVPEITVAASDGSSST